MSFVVCWCALSEENIMSIADLLVRLGRGLYALLLFVEKILICVYSEICLALGAKNICPVHRFVQNRFNTVSSTLRLNGLPFTRHLCVRNRDVGAVAAFC